MLRDEHLRRLVAVILASSGFFPAIPMLAAEQSPVVPRDFPETLTVDEPGVDDVLALPQLMRQSYQGSETGRYDETDVSFGMEKRLSEELGLTIASAYTVMRLLHGVNTGWQNTDATLKYNFLNHDRHEHVASFGITREFGGTGASRVGAKAVGFTAATVYGGQGLGQADQRWLRPAAITASLGANLPDRHSPVAPDTVAAGLTLQYDLAYLQPEGNELGRSHLLGRFTLLGELSSQRTVVPVTVPQNVTRLALGILYRTGHVQAAMEMLVPLAGDAGRGLGTVLQISIFPGGAFERTLWQHSGLVW